MGDKTEGCKGLTRIVRTQAVHQVFLGYAAAYRDARPGETWKKTARSFIKRFDVHDVDEEALIRTASNTIKAFIAEGI